MTHELIATLRSLLPLARTHLDHMHEIEGATLEWSTGNDEYKIAERLLSEYDAQQSPGIAVFASHANAQRVRAIEERSAAIADKIEDQIAQLQDVAGELRGIAQGSKI